MLQRPPIESRGNNRCPWWIICVYGVPEEDNTFEFKVAVIGFGGVVGIG